MDVGTLTNIALVVLFVVVGGVFAATEMALVSLRESQLSQLEHSGRRGSRVAAVARDPGRFLASVQIGVTVAGFLSAAYGASTLAPDVVPVLRRAGLSDGAADTVALVSMTLAIAYLSLVLGELVPKRLAMQRAAGVSLALGPGLARFTSIARPVVWLLSVSSDAVIRLLGGDPHARSERMTDAELRDLVVAHEGLPEDERRILVDVLAAAERTLGEVLRPRGEVAFLASGITVSEAKDTVRKHPYSRYPVTGEGVDDIVGFLHVRDLLDAPDQVRVAVIARDILHLPRTKAMMPSLSLMRREGSHIAVVVDEHGGTDGIVTLEDLVEELVGDIRDEYDPPGQVEATPGVATTVDGGVTIEEFHELTGITLADGPYETAAGFVLSRLGRLAQVGDPVRVGDHLITVAAVEGYRITRLTTSAVEPETTPRDDG